MNKEHYEKALAGDKNLSEADLWGADLSEADLRGAGCSIMYLGEYFCTVWIDTIRVGCQMKPLKWWKELTEEQAEEIATGGASWLKIYKSVILATAKALKKDRV